MEHLVKFVSAEGKEGQHVAAGLDEALAFVERLRNAEEAAQVRVFRMQEIPIEFRAYYKVELKATEGAAAEAPEPAEGVVPAPPVIEVSDVPSGAQPPIVIPADSPAAVNGDAEAPSEGKRLFSRS